MGYPTPIEWTDATWNPIGGCSIKSPGCIPCYAQQLAGTRLANHPLYAGITTLQKGRPVFNGKLTAAPDGHDIWKWPVTWRGAKEPKLGAGQPSTVFVGDMSDLFHEDRPRAVIDKVIAGIIHSRHIGQLLTKRPDVMCDYIFELEASGRWFLFNHPLFDKPNFAPEARFDRCIAGRLWLGMSAERQQEFDERWPYLRRLAVLGFNIFISFEPALGPLQLPADFLALGRRAQVIAGGMSGKNDPRPSHPNWFRAVRDQCADAGVAFFFKQWGEYAPCRSPVLEWSEPDGLKDVEITVMPDPGTPALGTSHDKHLRRAVLGRACTPMARVGKQAAGRLLDGKEHNEFPSTGAAA